MSKKSTTLGASEGRIAIYKIAEIPLVEGVLAFIQSLSETLFIHAIRVSSERPNE